MFSQAPIRARTGNGGASLAMTASRQHRRRAGHVGLHVDHAVGGLEREASRVEGDALPTSATWAAWRLGVLGV